MSDSRPPACLPAPDRVGSLAHVTPTVEILAPGEAKAVLPLVYKSWLTSYRPYARVVVWGPPARDDPRWQRSETSGARLIPRAACVGRDAYWWGQHAVIDRILARGVDLRVVRDPESPVIWAWAVSEGELLHYVYAKEPFRRLGLANALLAAASPTEYSHWTPDGGLLLSARAPQTIINHYGSACGPTQEEHHGRAAEVA